MKDCPKCDPKHLCDDCFERQVRDLGYVRCPTHGLLVPAGSACVACFIEMVHKEEDVDEIDVTDW